MQFILIDVQGHQMIEAVLTQTHGAPQVDLMRLMVENERSLTALVAGMTKMSWTTLTTSEK